MADSVEMLERIARNLPIRGKIVFRRFQSNRGEILFAYGKDGFGVYYGVWGVTRGPGLARTVEFKKGTTAKQVTDLLISDAYEAVGDFARHDVMDKELWDASRA